MHRVIVSFTDTKVLSALEIVTRLMNGMKSSQDWRCTAVHTSISYVSSIIELETENTFQSVLYMTKDIAELGDLHNIMFSFKLQPVPKDSKYTVILSVYDLYTDLDHFIEAAESAESDNINAAEPKAYSLEDLPSLTMEDVNGLVAQAIADDKDTSDAEGSFRLGVAMGYQLLMNRITKGFSNPLPLVDSVARSVCLELVAKGKA